MREWLAKNPEQAEKNRARASLWKKDNPTRSQINKRRRDLMARYGMTIQEWDELFVRQGCVCAICGTDKTGKHGWHTDHCHVTNKVRGILCGRCNQMLGHASDDSSRLRMAANYLDRSY